MVRVAGRIMLRRGQGKVNFLQLGDWFEITALELWQRGDPPST
jgi:lysyl-tRNA synthetase class II